MDLAAFLPGEGRPKQLNKLVMLTLASFRVVNIFCSLGEEASYSSCQPVGGDTSEKTEHLVQVIILNTSYCVSI